MRQRRIFIRSKQSWKSQHKAWRDICRNMGLTDADRVKSYEGGFGRAAADTHWKFEVRMPLKPPNRRW